MSKVLSKGVYTLPEAARLLREKPSTLRRWAFGYERSGVRYEPAIKTELPTIDNVQALTFLELIELLFIRGFLKSGVSWYLVREAARVAARIYQTEHPFAMKRWFADPSGIYGLLDRAGEPDVFVELRGDGQIAMRHTLEAYLHQIDFDISDIAQRWYPMGKTVPVVVDPLRAYGAPVIEGTSTTTAVVAKMHAAGSSVDELASWFEIDEWKIESAIRFEREFSRR